MSTSPQPHQTHRSVTLRAAADAKVLPLWEEHVAQWTGPRQLQVRVPLIGWFTASPFAHHVADTLQRRWTMRALEGQSVELVAANCDERSPRRLLTLLVTFAEVPTAERRLDGLQMARDVRAAVHAAGADDHAGRTPPVTVEPSPRLV